MAETEIQPEVSSKALISEAKMEPLAGIEPRNGRKQVENANVYRLTKHHLLTISHYTFTTLY